MDNNPLSDLTGESVIEFVTTASIGDIKTALGALPDDTRITAARRVHEIETSREDEAPRKTLVLHLEDLLGDDVPSNPDDVTPPADPSDDVPSDPDDVTPPADPEPVPSASVRSVTLDRDCTLSLRGQVLKCKKGDVLTGEAAAYALVAGAPVTEVDPDDSEG